ncbi:hypothetical protein LAM67_26720, partial [Mycobacterium tuberculosis]|nr:hypothetical protein [Mycobacterium tuberculosis]
VPATPWALLGLLAMPVAWKANAPVRARATGAGLIPALAVAGLAAFPLALSIGLAAAPVVPVVASRSRQSLHA